MAGKAVRALGLMSGTSVDGVDAAVLETDGVEILGFGDTWFMPYATTDRDLIRRGFGLWPGQEVALLAEVSREVTLAHVAAAGEKADAEVIGFHGQTLSHDPAGGRTFQIGDGAALSKACQVSVVSDFRSADVASGGEGAPLVPVFHHALARWLGLERPVVFLNIGGVANVTWVDPRVADPGAALVAFDTGPGNALIDDLMTARGGAARDEGGRTALAGRVDETALGGWLGDPYFSRPAPKSLDRQHFQGCIDDVATLSLEDAVATLAAFTARAVLAGVAQMPEPPERWLVAGGGRHNAALMAGLTAGANVPVEPVEAVGLDGDFIEAQAFAYLAVRVMRGLPTSFPSTTGARVPVCGGRVDRPD